MNSGRARSTAASKRQERRAQDGDGQGEADDRLAFVAVGDQAGEGRHQQQRQAIGEGDQADHDGGIGNDQHGPAEGDRLQEVGDMHEDIAQPVPAVGRNHKAAAVDYADEHSVSNSLSNPLQCPQSIGGKLILNESCLEFPCGFSTPTPGSLSHKGRGGASPLAKMRFAADFARVMRCCRGDKAKTRS